MCADRDMVSRLGPWAWAALLLAVLLAAACAGDGPGPVPSAPPRAGRARVVLYLQCPARPSDPLSFRLRGLVFERRDGGSVAVPAERLVRAGECAERQLRLADADLPAGRYAGIRWLLADARVERGGETRPLALPGEDGAFAQAVDLTVPEGGAVAWFADWRADESVVDDYLFSPRMDVRPQGMGMRDVLLFAASAASGTVTVVDRQGDRVVAVIGVGREPRGLAASPMGDRVYVANAGSGEISVIDPATCRVVHSIPPTGAAPWSLAASDDGRWLVATNPEADSVTVMDMRTEIVERRIAVGRRPGDILFDPGRGLFYVANRDSNSVSVVDPRRADPVRTVPVGQRPAGLALQGGSLYVADSGAAGLSVVAVPAYAVADTVQVDPGPEHLLAGLSDRIYVASGGSDEVAVVYAPMAMITTTVRVGGSPGRMAVDRTLRKLYVADRTGGRLAVVDLAAMRATGWLEVGDEPHGVLVLER